MLKLKKILTLVISLAIIFMLFKIFIRLLPIILVFILISLIPFQKIFEKFTKKREFESAPGQIYKQCGYCKKKTERTALNCDFCGRPFE